MAIKYLGETLDIHAGGVDLIFPHHENEIAQSESLTGKQFSRFWLHAEFLMVEGQKMAKSLGNYFTLRDLIGRGYKAEAIRYLLASVPYRKSLNFTFDGLQAAQMAIERLRNFKLRLDTEKLPEGGDDKMAARTEAAAQAFVNSLDDDLNTAEALAAAFEYARDANSAMDAGQFGADNRALAVKFFEQFDAVFDVLRPSGASAGDDDAKIEALIAEREAARKARNFARADQIRDELLAMGIILEDTKSGVRWKRK
jgi:cysteinyl-tRNA synthetase